MDTDVTRFKEMVTVPWSDEVILKMIRKHGLDFTINTALDGGIPDIELPSGDDIVLIEEAPVPMDVTEMIKTEEEPIKESAPIEAAEATQHVEESNGDHQEQPRTPEGIEDDDEEAWVQELKRSVSKKISQIATQIADMDEDFPDSQPVDTSTDLFDEDLMPDPVFTRRMSVLYDSDTETPSSPTKTSKKPSAKPSNDKKRPRAEALEALESPAPKRAAAVDDLQTQISSLPPGSPSHSQVRHPSQSNSQGLVASQSSIASANRTINDDRTFIKSLGLPPLLSDFPPHDFRRMQVLSIPPNGDEGEKRGNLLMWEALLRNQCLTVNGREKSEAERRSEVLMAVDMDFAYSTFGGPVMDLLEGPQFNIRVVTARLPCRNTIIFRRIGHEFQLNRLTAVHNAEESQQLEAEEGYAFASQATASSQPASLPPISAYTVDMDEMLVILTPLQWVRPHFNNKQSSYLLDVQAMHPGKRISVLVLHPKKLFIYPHLSTDDVGKFMPEMMFEYDLNIVYTEYGPDSLQVATVLSNMHKAMANRAYDFASLDGPFRTFPHAGDSRVPDRHPTDAYIAMLTASGVTPAVASHIAKYYRSPLALHDAYEQCKDEESAKLLLKDHIPSLENGYLSKDHSLAVWKAFSAESAKMAPFKNPLP